jgi:hypothetical protein
LAKDASRFLVLALKFFPLSPKTLLISDDRIEVFAYPYVGLANGEVVLGSSPKTSLSIAERKSLCLVVFLPYSLI